MSVTWEDVVRLAGAMPEVAESTSYRTPAIKVGGKLMGRLRTDADGSLALRCSAAEKQALLAGGGPAFHTTPHYDGYDYILIHLDLVDPAELAELLEDAWHLVAPPAVKRRAGP